MTEIPSTNPTIPVPNVTTMFPAQGTTAPRIARSIADLDKFGAPEEIRKAIYLDKDGNLLPEWAQVSRMYHRPEKWVAIVGFADTRADAPYNDPRWEIWGLNDLHGSIPRYDRWFDIHPLDNIDQDYNLIRNRGQTPPETIGTSGLKKLNVPIYMQKRFDDIPNSLSFPLKEIKEAFQFGDYMTNSISYMIALAIYEGYQRIHVFGVDMAVAGEYTHQRPSCEYWLGVAAGKGIEIYIPPASDLLHCAFMYGFEAAKQKLVDEKIDRTIAEMLKRKSQIDDQLLQGQRASWQYDGAVGAMREMKKVHANCDTKL